jgi:beta-glucanase (GH16 family)
VTSFITYSPRKDEIDWEFVGGETNSAQSNVFYKGIEEYGVRSGKHNVGGQISEMKEYTIDWNSQRIQWLIDGKVVRTYAKNGTSSASRNLPATERYYPEEATPVQIGIWDGGSGSSGVSSWAGGKIPWGDRRVLGAQFEWIDIQCYDDKDQPVPKWPPSSPDMQKEDLNQPTRDGQVNEGRTGSTGSVSSGVFDHKIDPVQGLPQQSADLRQGLPQQNSAYDVPVIHIAFTAVILTFFLP